ncbi:MAG: phosphomannomutase/phosphoglucomutase [Thermodesulfovibrionales bacterium]|nr:phosphomannomutase/phosphoglucomutase [Thermodesulfovibrionales bacterium]
MINPSIFRQYDVRGIWGKDLTEEVIEKIGRAFAVYLKGILKKEKIKVSIGRDVRLSSSVIFEALSRGLLGSGIDVVDIGVCPTPLQYFSLFHLPVDGGVMITGSHNPPEFNGLKLSVGKETLYGEKIQDIRKICDGCDFIEGEGKAEVYEIIPKYMEHLKRGFPPLSRIKVVIDAGNGTGGLIAPQLMRDLGCEVIELYCEPDGNFPNHHPDPTVMENIKDLIAEVVSSGADVGIGYDGDADRIGVVSDKGEVIWGDRLMIIFARDIIETQNSKLKTQKLEPPTFVGEVKCSQVMYDEIKRLGGNPIMWKAGHSLIKHKMKEAGALLGGEMSGHIFFADRYFGYDDAIYTSLRLLEILSKKGSPYSIERLLSDVPKSVSTPEIRLGCPDDIKFKIVERAKEVFRDYPLNDIDGIRINFDKGWGLIRASNTQPALVLRFEAKDEDSLREIREIVEGKLNAVMVGF